MVDTTAFDVLIIGSGMMGAAVARSIREARPDASIAMIAGGPGLGPRTGQHLHDVEDPEIWELYNQRVASGIQAFYTGVAPSAEVGATMQDIVPGMQHLAALGELADQMPSAAVAWNAGGMAVHWTAATPFPWGSEVTPGIPESEWHEDLARAADLLLVNRKPYPQTEAGAAVVRVLGNTFDAVAAEGRQVQDMPMAINDDGSGLKVRTSPSVIFPPIADGGDPHFRLFSDTLVTAVRHREGHASGADCRQISTGAEFVVEAAQVVVCADAIRTPQLLFASGIRPSALGRYLNEHVFLTGLVLADPDELGFALESLAPPTDHEWASDCIWVPHSDAAQPFQVHVMNTVMVDEDRTPIAYGVGLEVYIPTEIQRDNRLEFSDEAEDAFGLPRITVHFSYTAADRDRVELAKSVQSAVGRSMGRFDPAKDAAVLPAGSSLHFTGTVRMGAEDDGTSVCDLDARVWGFDNLYVAGNGVIPTALACNSTLTGMVTAVRAARAVSGAI